MANKQLFKSRPGRLPPETDARNEAGGKAYALSPEAALAQYVATGCRAGSSSQKNSWVDWVWSSWVASRPFAQTSVAAS